MNNKVILHNKTKAPLKAGDIVWFGIGRARKPYTVYKIDPTRTCVGIKSLREDMPMHRGMSDVHPSMIDCCVFEVPTSTFIN